MIILHQHSLICLLFYTFANEMIESRAIQHSTINNKSMNSMCFTFSFFSHNQSSSIPANRIGDEGGKAIAEALKVNTTLTNLNLCGEKQSICNAMQ